MAVSEQALMAEAGRFSDPHAGKPLAELNAIKSVSVGADDVGTVDVALPYPCARDHQSYAAALKKHLVTVLGMDITVAVDQQISAHAVQKGVKRIDAVRNIIAVASGKGGVGKSTTAVNLALALSSDGANVGVLDADVYGPSIPRMLNLSGQPETPDGKHLEPHRNFALQVMSMGFLVDEQKPMIWRGPMVTQALEQLLNLTNWQDLDYLIVDLPPGTGDTQLTLAQKVPVSGAIVITTPQDVALADARKGLKMFESVDVPILGVIENMSFHRCIDCGRQEHLFGRGGGARLSEETGYALLGELPLDLNICEQADTGCPTVVSEPDGVVAGLYRAIARRSAATLALQAKDYATKFPNIVIENN